MPLSPVFPALESSAYVLSFKQQWKTWETLKDSSCDIHTGSSHMKSCQHSESSAVLRIILSRFGGLFFRVTYCNQKQISDVESGLLPKTALQTQCHCPLAFLWEQPPDHCHCRWNSRGGSQWAAQELLTLGVDRSYNLSSEEIEAGGLPWVPCLPGLQE